MKLKTILFAALLAVSTISIYSQSKLSLGFEAGLNIANTVETPSSSFGSKMGFIIGGMLDANLSPNFSLQPGVRFITKGSSYSGADGVATFNSSVIEIDALAKVKFPLTEIKPYLFAGPSLGFIMSVNYSQTPTGGTSSSQDVSQYFESIDFGLMFGGGLDFKVAPTMDLFGQFGYSLGLSNIRKNNPAATTKTTGIQITTGLRFKL
ncbi:MAG: PorT family protein [Ignavibacteria bacterium]|nr:PorT family protein [Ignavibacteria bacterium]